MILNNKYYDDGIPKGSIGYIVEIYDSDYCEVEFSDSNGITYALRAINKVDFAVLDN